MYQNKLAVAIKHNGKILRENKDLVQLPFGSEFSVLVKNLNSRRVKFTLHIDGTDVLDGTEIIVDANSEVEMKRFIRNGNMNEGNAFKFIERTAAIEDGPRGIKIDDGVVKVQFWFEKEKPEVKTVIHNNIWWDEYYRRHYPFGPYYSGPYYGVTSSIARDNVKLGSATSAEYTTKGLTRGSSLGSSSMINGQNAAVNQVFTSNTLGGSEATYSASTPTMDSVEAKAEINDAGITVPGSKVEQAFKTVYGFDAEVNSHVIILRLAGKVGKVEVAAPVTVKTKQKCTTCHHVNKANAKYCSACGTSLDLL